MRHFEEVPGDTSRQRRGAGGATEQKSGGEIINPIIMVSFHDGITLSPNL